MCFPKVPSGLDQIVATFGSLDDPNFQANNIVLFNLPYPLSYAGTPVARARAHKLVVPVFQAVFSEINNAGLSKLATDYSGIYAARPIRGYASHPSTHSWGIAIDLDAASNQMGTVGDMDPQIIAIFKKYGFFWGGDFHSRKDPMHFQYANNY